MIAVALNLARKGIAIFPCKNMPADKEQNKAPHTANGFKDATADVATVEQWWHRWPNALIGVPAGERFVVVDVDCQHADARDWLKRHTALIPPTRTHLTQSGGLHFLFQPHAGIKCTTSKLGPHVDTRGGGGYIIFWPACGLEVIHADVLAPVPDWIVEALSPARAAPREHSPIDTPIHARAKLNGIVRTIATAPEGRRNAITYWGATKMADMVEAGMLAKNTAINLIVEAASRCGLPSREAQRTAESGLDNKNRQRRQS
jgi:hypothetical protein